MIRYLQLLGGALLAAALVACGGGGGSAGTQGNGSTSNTTTPTVADFTVSSDKSVLNTSGTDIATITVVAVDASRNVVPNAPVFVTVDHNGVFTPGGTVTDSTGKFTGTLSIGTDTSERDITVTVTIKSIVKTLTVHVSASNTDFAMFLDKSTIANAGSDSATLTVVALDSDRNVVPNTPVSVTVNNNGVFTPTAGAQTDGTGTYKGTVTIGSDKRDRDITLTVTVAGKVKSTVVHVAGSRLTVQAAPSAPSPGQTVTLTLSLTDSAGAPLASTALTVGGTIPALQGRVLTTAASGLATTTFAAPTQAGFYTINASGNGTFSSDYQLQVFSNQVDPATIPPGVTPSLSASPNVLSVNSPGSTTNRTTLRFLFLDSNNQPIQNVRVHFVDTTLGLAKVGAQISSGDTTLYTDAGGTVTTEYISGQNSSPTNGVTVKACYKATDFTSVNDCPASVTASLTVAGQALSVSVGDDNLLTKSASQVTYIKKFAVTVADSAGRAVADAPVDISVDITHYGKGQFVYTTNLGGSYEYLDSTGTTSVDPLTVVPLSLTGAYPSMSTDPNGVPPQRVWCPNEDTNRNGNVDPGENVNGSVDSNNQPTLEPRKSDIVISYDVPTVTKTDSSGVLIIRVEYAQRFGTWLAYKVRVTANVAGSQGMAEREFVTDVQQNDVENGSFRTPPYGTHSCLDPN
ncbi:MAG TPA: hypothetical protein VHA82_01165 [Ramlibacter sp.]|uniref:hypothetical protein n=1 Tax=Ramlibacter sp. TaxID=1917967 RepID=UPI002CDB6889|nr:hypothetical protein [Ramlibacter sp.]HVZ42391.1 hypothetical protein [Ramlibacter sp.]